MQKFMIIAVDGPAASGKSTLAKNIADRLNYLYVDTGAMYRAITYYALENKIEENEPAVIEAVKNIALRLDYKNGVTQVFINNEDVTSKIRTPRVNAKVSDISKIKEVREQLVKLQQQFGKENNLVVEGRDTTTVVFPNADLKVFLTAEAKERAKRRHKEYTEKEIEISVEDVEKSLLNRDKIDSERKVSPLKKADDAFELDTTDLSIEEVINKIIDKVKEIKTITNNMLN
ncbi:MAG: cytidylate kinase [Ignavibacteriae bacterium]|nr:MAG: cytidylate kinase [Ignavibacteriota bacterium]